MNDEAVYKFRAYFGRMGELTGVFVAKKSEVAAALGRIAYFGEVLGKHSDVYLELSGHDFSLVTDDFDFVSKFSEFKLETGFNPLKYLEQ